MTLTKLLKLSFPLVLFLQIIGIQVSYATTGFSISGFVKDSETGETLPGVTVRLEPGERGAITNVDGFYSIPSVLPGTYALRFSFIGYSTETKLIDVTVN